MSELDAIQSTHLLDDDSGDSATETLLDGSSLGTVLAMLEVIDSLEELALLETLTSAQKRQVWEATPETTRQRLKQLRMTGQVEPEPQSSDQTLQPTHQSEIEEIEELDVLQPEAQLQLTHQLIQNTNGNGAAAQLQPKAEPPGFAVGDWIVLQAKPQLPRAELMAIWEVLALEGNNARIFAQQLGHRTYPITWMMLYPKPADYVEPEF